MTANIVHSVTKRTSHIGLMLSMVLGVGCCVVFIHKPVHIDSDMMIHVARQLWKDPVNPPLGEFGRDLALHNRTGMPESSVYYRCPHPPLVPLLLSPISAVAGSEEWLFHLAMLPFYIAAVWAGWFLLGMFFRPRLQVVGTLFWALSPALLVNAQNVMWDVPIAVCILLSLAFFIKAIRTDRARWYVLAGLTCGFGALTKMTILPLYCLCVGYLLFMRRWKQLIFWALPALVLPGLWVAHNLIIFGKVQYLSTEHLKPIVGDVRYRFERIIGYLGGCLIPPLWWLWIILSKKKRTLVFLPFLVLVGLWSVLLVVFLGKPVLFAAAYWIFASTGLWVLMRTVTLSLGSSRERLGRREGMLLSLFSLIYLITMEFLPLASVRFILPLIPLSIIALLHCIEPWPRRHQNAFFCSVLPLTFLLAVGLSYADYQFAEADRLLPQWLAQHGFAPEKTWYFGKLSYGYYLHQAGYRNLATDPSTPEKGHYILEQEGVGDRSVRPFFPESLRPAIRDTFNFGRFPLRTKSGYAGFYGNTRLSWTVTLRQWQKTVVVSELIPLESEMVATDAVAAKGK